MDAALVFLGLIVLICITLFAIVKAWFVNKEAEAERLAAASALAAATESIGNEPTAEERRA